MATPLPNLRLTRLAPRCPSHPPDTATALALPLVRRASLRAEVATLAGQVG